MTENSSTQPGVRRITREAIAARIAAPADTLVDKTSEQRSQALDAIRKLAETAAAQQEAATKALSALLSASESVLPEFGVPARGTATAETEASQAEAADLFKLLEIVGQVTNKAKNDTEEIHSKQYRPLGVRVAVSSVRWGHVKQTATAMGMSRTHLSRLIEEMFPGFLATVAPDKRSKHGHRGVRSPNYTSQTSTDS
ncbi:hypothetical protein [Streptomyces pseudogriseolus]|uniref:hypothetical protein n=1 Tax=Streptomyces pseudogriseolus TaxID=36817 RepID=UPI003FA1F74A